MKRAVITALVALFGAVAGVHPAAAQRLVDDWLVRTGAGPTALQIGPAAAFWNPAGIMQPAQRGSAVVLELLAPEATGVDVLAVSGAWGLDDRTTVAAGYQHFAIEGIRLTELSPEDSLALDISQDLFTASAARQVGGRLRVGGTAQYLRSSPHLDDRCQGGTNPDVACRARDQLSVGVGLRFDAPLPVPVVAAGYAHSLEDRIVWAAGIDVSPELPLGAWRSALRFGASGGRASSGLTYRGSVAGQWRDAVTLEAGLVGEPDALSRQWEPELAATVRLHRYELGVVREWLPNSFGTVHTFRFGVSF